MTTSDKLNYLLQTKSEIKQAIIDKGVAVSDSDTFRSYATKIGEISSGGGGGSDSGGQFLVQVIDYDGTVLKSDHLDTGSTFTLPDAPTHDRLTFQEWSSPVTITNNTITVGNSDITIGSIYITTSGLTEFDITLTKKTGLSVTCSMAGTKNWGDGTQDSLTSHTYSNYGNYTITCDGTTIPMRVFGQSASMPTYICTAVRIGSVTQLTAYAFQNCYSLVKITIPNTVTRINSDVFVDCRGLISITIPQNVAFYTALSRCYALNSVVLPNKSDCTVLLNYCYSLKSITYPNISFITANCLAYCYSIKRVTIPQSVTRIADSFVYCENIMEYDFTSCVQIPNLSNANIFNGINYTCKIYVPDNLYDDWIVATNWVNYADYIYKASEMED